MLSRNIKFLAIILIGLVNGIFDVEFAHATVVQDEQVNKQVDPEDEADAVALESQYQWLYETLFAPVIRIQFPERSFKSFRVHLKDSYQNFVQPNLIRQINLKAPGLQKGAITYVGIIPKSYRYNIALNDNGTVLIQVKIHLKDPRNNDLLQFRSKVQQAEDIWNHSLIPMDFTYRFQFVVTEIESEAYYSVNVLDSTRGPYDTNWGRSWTGRTIAHEIGHMMGLGDEYQTLSGKSDCLQASLMCSSSNGELMAHHYYFILRRLVKLTE